MPLPPHSPELQPAERLWPLTNEPIAKQSFPSLDAKEEKLFQRCRTLLQQQEYEQALKQRGSISFWVSEEVIQQWRNEQKTGRKGASN